MSKMRNARSPVVNGRDLPDLGHLVESPDRVREVPAEAIPQLIGAVELRAAALGRLKAELWACLLGNRSENTAQSRPDVPSQKRLRASDSRDSQATLEPSAALAHVTRRLMTVRQFCEAHPAFTEGSLRWFLFNRSTNGLSAALVKKGRRIWIDVDAFFEWLG